MPMNQPVKCHPLESEVSLISEGNGCADSDELFLRKSEWLTVLPATRKCNIKSRRRQVGGKNRLKKLLRGGSLVV